MSRCELNDQGVRFYEPPGNLVVSISASDTQLEISTQSGPGVNLLGVQNIQVLDSVQLEETGAGTGAVSIKAPVTITIPYTITMPPAQAAANSMALVNNGSGTLRWDYPAGGSDSGPYISVNAPTYTVQPGDLFIGIQYTVTGPATVTLPPISTVGRKIYHIIDTGGGAKKNTPITTVPSPGSGNLISGQVSKAIEREYGSISVVSDGISGWFIFSELAPI